MARPTKLTKKLAEQILKLVQMGVCPDVAAGAYGVGRTTFYEWIQRGRGTHERPTTPLLAAFVRDVETAIAKSEAHLTLKLAEYCNGSRKSVRDPQRRVRTRVTFRQVAALQWMLARRFPKRWGGHSIEESLDGQGEQFLPPQIRVLLANLPPEEEPEEEINLLPQSSGGDDD